LYSACVLSLHPVLRLLHEDGVLTEFTLGRAEADVSTTVLKTTLVTVLEILVLGVRSESPSVGDDDVLSTRELVLGASEGLDDVLHVGLLRTDGEDDLTDVDTGNHTSRLSESLTHSCLQSIGACTTQHFVDAEDVEGVSTDTHVEGVLTGQLGHVLVDHDTSGFESLRGELFILS